VNGFVTIMVNARIKWFHISGFIEMERHNRFEKRRQVAADAVCLKPDTKHRCTLLRLLRCAATLILLIVGTVAGNAQQSIDTLSWLSGHWVNERGPTMQEEYWMLPSGGMMPGLHRDVGETGRAFFEYLRIVERNGVLYYHASPGGKAETVFTADSLAYGFIRFINIEHDYPQRIQYALDTDGTLRASISDAGGGKLLRWEYHRKR
jgi:hypothetical protein